MDFLSFDAPGRPTARLSACCPVTFSNGPVFAALRLSLQQKKHVPVRPKFLIGQLARTRFSRNKHIDVFAGLQPELSNQTQS